MNYINIKSVKCARILTRLLKVIECLNPPENLLIKKMQHHPLNVIILDLCIKMCYYFSIYFTIYYIDNNYGLLFFFFLK